LGAPRIEPLDARSYSPLSVEDRRDVTMSLVLWAWYHSVPGSGEREPRSASYPIQVVLRRCFAVVTPHPGIGSSSSS